MQRRTFLQAAAGAALATPALAQRVQTLRFVPQANLTALDPIWTTATVTSNHGYYVFDTLYSADHTMKPRPQMAEGHEVSADNRVWRIRLRDGLRFHDGTPVRAQDCIASVKRWAVREPMGQLLARTVESWNAPDDRTIELRLHTPFPLVLEALAKPDASVPFIMPERLANTDANTAVTEVVGSGPYRFVPGEYVSGSRVVYAKFDGYVPRTEAPDWATGAKVANIPRIEWQVIPDSATAGAALQRGEIEWWERPLNDLLPMLAKSRDIETSIQDSTGRMALMRLNHLQPPFNDPKVRRAVLMSVDQEEYMRAMSGDDPALWKVCRSVFPCGTAYESEVRGKELIRGDLDAARRMLKESGYSGQKVVIINPTDFPQIGPLGQVTADRLRRIGMNVDLQESDWGTVIQRRASREPTEKGGWSIFHTNGSSPGYSDPAVSALVRGLGGRGWFGWWDSPQVEGMVQDWLSAPDEGRRKALGDAIGNLALEEVATVPLGMFFIKTAYRKGLTGLVQGPSPYPWGARLA